MPLLLPRILKRERITAGERALVYRVKGKGIPKRMIGRFFFGEPLRKQEPVKEMFFKNKIAQRLYPKNFIKVKAAWKTKLSQHGRVLLSEEKYLDVKSRSLILKLGEAIKYPWGSLLLKFQGR